jgi:hypothetical protein
MYPIFAPAFHLMRFSLFIYIIPYLVISGAFMGLFGQSDQ